MYQYYVLGVFIVYLFFILLRTEVFLSQFQALAKKPSLLFSLGFIGLVMGLAIVMTKKRPSFARFLGMPILMKSILVIDFPLRFAQGLFLPIKNCWRDKIFFLLFWAFIWGFINDFGG